MRCRIEWSKSLCGGATANDRRTESVVHSEDALIIMMIGTLTMTGIPEAIGIPAERTGIPIGDKGNFS